MDKILGQITTAQESILEGGHHIVAGVKLADGLENLRAGTILYRAADGWRPLPADYAGEKPAAVLLDPVASATSGTVAAAAVHGAIRNNKAAFANGAPATAGVADALRSAGIYLLGDPLPSALAPQIVADLGDHSIAVGDALALTFLVAPRDDGSVSRQWFGNTSASASGGTLLSGETGENYTVDTSAAGTLYFYCVATNRLNNTEAAAVSAVAAITVSAP